MRRPGILWAARVLALLAGGLLVLPPLPVEAAAGASSSRRVVKRSTTGRSAVGARHTRSRSARASSGVKRRSVRSTRLRRARYSARTARARRAALARARAAAVARALRAAMTPQFRFDADGNRVPDIRAAAAIVYNPVTHQILYESNAQDQRSIASITKVMTALVFLENEPDLTRGVTIETADVRGASHTYLRAGEHLTTGDLLHLLLIGSDNAAARALARDSVAGYDGFIDAMNEKARQLGLQSTEYADPSGLDAANVSSAYDMARLISFAASNERIASIMRTSEHRLTTSRRSFTLRNTNKLLGGDLDVRGGKTGFIRQAGYCLATMLRLPQGDPIAVVVLGARSNTGRFWETRHLANWLRSKTGVALRSESQQQE